MKRTGLMRVKRASLLALLTVVGNLSFYPADLTAAEKAKETPLTIRLDFIVGGNHAPWFVAWEKGFYAKRGLNVTIQPGTGSAIRSAPSLRAGLMLVSPMSQLP